jgi:4-amino-4-deoxy-L-arabinose transferase-like glycosyltransferase
MKHRRSIPFLPLIVFLLSFLLLAAGGRTAPQDEETTYRMAANLIEFGRLTMTTQDFTLPVQSFPGFLPRTQPRTLVTTWAGEGVDGQTYPQYTHAQSLLEVPLYLLGRLLGGDPSTSAGVALTKFTTSLLNPLLIALSGWLVAVFASHLNFSRRLSILLGLAYPLATMALAYVDTNFSEPLLAFAVLLATYAAYRARSDHSLRYLALSGAALGLAIYTRERSVILLPPFLLYVFLTQPRRRWIGWLTFLIPIGIAGALIGAWNWLRFGSPLTTSYAAWQPETGFSTPIVVGVFGLWLSAGKGLLFYNPIVWLGLIGLLSLWRRDRALAALIGLNLLIPTIFFARYDLWTGGWNWGPRYLLPLLPLLVLTAGHWVHAHPSRFRRSLLLAACALGLALNLPAVLVDHSRYLVAAGERDPDQYLKQTLLQFDAAPLAQQWPAVLELARVYQEPGAWQAAQDALDQQLQGYSSGAQLETLSTAVLQADEFLRLNAPAPWPFRMLLLDYPAWMIGLAVSTLLMLLLISGYALVRSARS